MHDDTQTVLDLIRQRGELSAEDITKLAPLSLTRAREVLWGLEHTVRLISRWGTFGKNGKAPRLYRLPPQ